MKIKKDDLINAYKEADKSQRQLLENLFGKEVFKCQLKITDRIKTFDDVLDYHCICSEKFYCDIKNLSNDTKAYEKLKLIASALNEGWTPDWDKNEYKYYPWFKMSSSGFRLHVSDDWRTLSSVGSRLCFKTSELANYAGEQFEDIYKKYLTIQ